MIIGRYRNEDNVVTAYDLTNVLHTMSLTYDETYCSWRATQNCWLGVYLDSTASGNNIRLSIDGTTVLICGYSAAHSRYSFENMPLLFVKKGSLVELNNKKASGRIKVYGCL